VDGFCNETDWHGLTPGSVAFRSSSCGIERGGNAREPRDDRAGIEGHAALQPELSR
jgi:hypothetical protein